jgi:hypothetical protein
MDGLLDWVGVGGHVSIYYGCSIYPPYHVTDSSKFISVLRPSFSIHDSMDIGMPSGSVEMPVEMGWRHQSPEYLLWHPFQEAI